MRKALALLSLLAGAAVALPAGADTAPAVACTDATDEVLSLQLPVDGQVADGVYALPASAPKGLVLMAHGYGHTTDSWRAHAQRLADQLGVIAVAMDYRGQHDSAPAANGRRSSRGWRVAEGAADTIAAARLFQSTCGIDDVVLFSVSMGGNTGGLALAAQPTRADGSPLFDYWWDLEGAANVTETYLEARSLSASGNAFANNAVADIEEEMGGPIEAHPQAYRDHTVTARADEVAGSGVKGVLLVHGVDDGLVPINQSRELSTELTALDVPHDFVTVLRRDAGTAPGTTAHGYAPVPVDLPFAGHASEADEKQTVMRIGFDYLTAHFTDGYAPCGEELEDDSTTPVSVPVC